MFAPPEAYGAASASQTHDEVRAGLKSLWLIIFVPASRRDSSSRRSDAPSTEICDDRDPLSAARAGSGVDAGGAAAGAVPRIGGGDGDDSPPAQPGSAGLVLTREESRAVRRLSALVLISHDPVWSAGGTTALTAKCAEADEFKVRYSDF